jgi:hypothetical protein
MVDYISIVNDVIVFSTEFLLYLFCLDVVMLSACTFLFKTPFLTTFTSKSSTGVQIVIKQMEVTKRNLKRKVNIPYKCLFLRKL